MMCVCCLYVCVYVHVYVHVYVYVYVHEYVYVHVYVHLYVCTSRCRCVVHGYVSIDPHHPPVSRCLPPPHTIVTLSPISHRMSLYTTPSDDMHIHALGQVIIGVGVRE